MPGGRDFGGAMVMLHMPPEPGIDAAVGIHAYGECRVVVLETLVRYDGAQPVWQLIEVLAVPAMGASEALMVGSCGPTDELDVVQGGVDPYVAIATLDNSTADPYATTAAWRVLRGKGFEPVSAGAIRCQRGDD